MSVRRRPPRPRAQRTSYAHSVRALDNGLDVVTVRLPHLHAAQIALLSGVGSRHERPEDNGLSHMLEHMFFRGCSGFSDSTALNGAMEDLGGLLDGFTTRDHSGYPVTVHPNHVVEATEILGLMFGSPRFLDIEIERKIILEEMLDALDDRGREIDIDTLAHRLHFGDHGLAQPIEGPRKNIRRFGVEDLERHRRRHYGARNLTLCFVGAIDPDECRFAAERAFSGLFPGRPRADGRTPSPVDPGFQFRRTEDPQTRLRVTFRAISDDHPDFPALYLLRRVLDGGLSARLQVEMVERRGLAYEVSADLATYADTGTLDFELAAAHKNIPSAVETLGFILEDVRQRGVPEAELERVRARVAIGVEMGLDSLHDMVQWFGVDHLFGRARGPEDRLATLHAVTPDDLLRVARTYLDPARMTAVGVGGARPAEVRAARKAMRALTEAAPGSGVSSSSVRSSAE